MIPSAIEAFMDPVDGPGNKYFDCELSINGHVKVPKQQCPVRILLLASSLVHIMNMASDEVLTWSQYKQEVYLSSKH